MIALRSNPMSPLAGPARAAAWALALALCAGAADRPAPAAAGTHSTTVSSNSGDGYTYGSVRDDADGGAHEAFQYALVEAGDHQDVSVSDSDAWPQVIRAQREAKRLGRPVFWFRLEDHSYLVTDAETVARASKILEPVRELGARQGAIGAEQGRWGAMQGEYGAIQGRLGALQARVALASVREGGDDPDLDAMKREIADLRVEARDLGERQRALGERQRVLGAQQGELGRKQGAASRHSFADLRELAHDAVANGRATRFDG
jgi:hypothetical protein